ncbi:Peptidase C11, clostripain [Candidatus Magnetomorum sp. HK-1]|nr:Peptidase C11, clostripain [Candidatus Magnetomorum sp. HK-1]
MTVKKINYLLCILVLCILIPISAQATSKWTIMIYLDADNNLEPDGIDDFLEISTTGSDEHINYVVQMDRIEGFEDAYGDWTDCKRFLVQKDMTPTSQNALESLGEINMGDPASLKDFIQWSMTNYPAQQYALILWDHGDGWQRKRTRQSVIKSICWDDTNGYEASLSMLDLKQVLSNLPIKPDLVGFDACLMGMIENAYMLKQAGISVMVGSEETEPAAGWPYDTIAKGLASNPQWNAIQLGQWIVDKYYSFYDMNETQAAIDLSKIDPLITALTTFSTAIRTSWQNNMDAIRTAAQTLRMRIDNAVINTKNGEPYHDAGGLSIYFPTDYYDSTYNQTDLAKDTSWNEFLSDYFESMTHSWISMARRQVLNFYDPNFIDLHHLCTIMQEFNPDNYKPGYSVEESAYIFDDIQSSGTFQNIDDEEKVIITPTDFKFSYYDNIYDTFYISDNGLIYFAQTYFGAVNESIPGSKEYNSSFIAPFWDDFYGASVYWEVKSNEIEKKLIVQWQDVSHYDYATDSKVTFQVILYEHGRICFQYKDTLFGNEFIDYGNSATIGLQGTQLRGLQYSFNQSVIKSPFALLFIPEDESGCHYSLTSYRHNVSPLGENRSVSLITDNECPWTASSQVNWINITSEKTGLGPVQIKFQVSENKQIIERSGKLDIGGRVLTVIQESSCSYEVYPLQQTVPASGSFGTITITSALAECLWTVESLVSWIIPIESSGSGSSSVSYTVTKNQSMNKRTGTLNINGISVTIVQEANDELDIALLENHTHLKNLSLFLGERLFYKIEIPPDHYSFKIITEGGIGDCDIYAKKDQIPTKDDYDFSSSDYNNAERIFISEPETGTWFIMLYAYEGFQDVNLSVSYLSQKCEYLLSETQINFSSNAASGEFYVSTDDLCDWSIRNFFTWIDITNIEEVNFGSATVHFTLSENTSIVERTAVLEVHDQFLEIIQEGNNNIQFPTLESGIPQTELYGTMDSNLYFKIIVPENQERLIVKLWGGSGDCDLFIRYNDFPDQDNNDDSSTNYSNDELIEIESPHAGEYFIMLLGYETYSNVTLEAEYRGTKCTYSFSETEITLDSSEFLYSIEILTQDECSWQAIAFDDWIDIQSESELTGSGDLLFSVLPNESNEQRTGVIEIAETLIFINQNSLLNTVALSNNVALTGLSLSNNQELYFVIDVPANQKNLIIDTWNGTGDVDLYAHYGIFPDDISPDYSCYAWGNDENIYIKNPDEGQWFILIVGYEESNNVSLKATYNTIDCHYKVTPMQSTFDAQGAMGILNIFVNDGCSWTTIKHGTWIEIDEDTRRGSGNGYVLYKIPVNEDPNIRTNNIRVADQWIAVMQSGTEDLSPMIMANNTPVTIEGATETSIYYQIEVPPGQVNLSFILSGGTGDCDLYVRHESFPTFRNYDFRPYIFGNDELVSIENANPGIWYAMIYGDEDFDDVNFRIVYKNNLANLISIVQVLVGVRKENDMLLDINLDGRVDIGDAIGMLLLLKGF